MENNKQVTAVEWLQKQLSNKIYTSIEDYNTQSKLAFEQAKAMEKQNMIKFANDFLFHDDTDLTAEQYYNETYGQNRD